MKLSSLDKDYFKKHLTEARSFQEKEFLGHIDTEMYKALYAGRDAKHDSYLSGLNDTGSADKYVQLNKLFPATNRVVPSLYYQNPRITFSPRKNTSDFSAKILTAAINYDYKEMKLKAENQMVVLDAWFTGFGACKLGYQTQFAYKPKDPKSPDKNEKIIDYIEYEGPWAKRIKSTDVFRDPNRPAGQDRIIWLRFKRTLQDILDSDVYDYDDNFVKKYRTKDPREVELDLYEGWIRNKDGLFIVVFCDGYDNPIRYDQSSWQGDGFPICFLSFAEINDMYYPPSFYEVATNPQKQINYIATLQGTIIDKFRNQTGINVKALDENGKRALERNELGGIVEFKEPPASHIASISSASIPADLFNVLNIMQENLQEILQVSGLRMGSGQAEDTATQDKLKDFGNQLGINGMQDKVREYVIEQATKLSQLRKQFSTGKSLVPIVGMDIINPINSKPITEEWLEFGTPNQPVTLKDAIAGDYDVEVDIKSAQKPNETVQLQAFEMLMTKLPQYEALLAEQNQKINWGKIVKIWLGLYKELVPSAESVVESMTPEEVETMKAKQAELKAREAEQIESENSMKSIDMANKAMNMRKNMTPENTGGME